MHDLQASLNMEGASTGPVDLSQGRRRSERGVVFVEYITVLAFVTLIGAAAIAALGIPLLHLFRYVQAVILLPIP